jgi:hypothetical protein
VITAANPSLALSSSGNLTFAPGATTGDTATISVTPAGGFVGAVTLTCAVTTSLTNVQDAPTCTVPSTVSITGASAATATLIVNTTASTTTALAHPSSNPYGPAAGAFAALTLFFFVPKRRRHWKHLATLLCAIAFGAAIGCGGSSKTTTSSNIGTTAGGYTVTVTATATGIAAQTTQVSVTVN